MEFEFGMEQGSLYFKIYLHHCSVLCKMIKIEGKGGFAANTGRR